MFVPGLLALAEAGVLSRRVYPDEARQRAAERGEAPVEGGVWLHGGFSSVRWRSTGAYARCRWKSAPGSA